MAERAGYTVTMFLVDVSPSMGKLREVETYLPNGEVQVVEMTNLEWSLQFVKLKVQEMIYNGRKTDQCGVILFGTEETNNIINRKDGGYEHVYEFVPIGTPNAATITKINSICPAEKVGDPVDALIVGIETQDRYLGNKKTWTRKMVLLTDGENPIELEDWEAAAQKMNDLKIRLIIIGVDFDDETYGFKEEDKSVYKRANEEFFHTFVEHLNPGLGDVGNCAGAIEEVSRPDVKQTRSALMGNILRLGDVEDRPDEAIEISIKTSKCTALARPKAFKKFTRIGDEDEDIIMRNTDDDDEPTATYGQLGIQTRYAYDPEGPREDDGEEGGAEGKNKELVEIEKEELLRGYKYGSTFVPAPDANFPKLETKKGIDICGFFYEKELRREWFMGEVQYIWADPASPLQQVALSSIISAMLDIEKPRVAIARWVTKDGADPKMGILKPFRDDSVDYFTWVQMPFADDVRKYTFPSLDKLINGKGEVVTKHPYIPTDDQMEMMENFVDALDLTEAGEEDEEGGRRPWYDTRLSYNPAIHRIKQAQFHAAIVQDLNKEPLAPPHPEILKYFDPPRKIIKRARRAIEAAKQAFNVKEVPKRVVRNRKDGHVRAREDGDDALLLEKQPNKRMKLSSTQSQSMSRSQTSVPSKSQQKPSTDDSDTEPEDDEQDLLLNQKAKRAPSPAEDGSLPTPSQTPAPNDDGRAPGRIIGSVAPLADFHKNIKEGDLVTKAVEDLAFVIRDIILRPFSANRVDEMLECIKALRTVCLEEDEIDAWNEFLPDLKRACLDDDPGNPRFWESLSAQGRSVSLISKSEAAQQGGKSDISDADAEQFMTSTTGEDED